MKEKSEKSKNTILPANKRKLLNRKIVANKKKVKSFIGSILAIS